MTLTQARALLDDPTVASLTADRATSLPAEAPGDPLLIEWLSQAHPAVDWRQALENLCVEPLDVNRASIDRLLRVPGLDPQAVAQLVAGRPYLSEAMLRLENSEAGALLDRSSGLVGHPGYTYPDKPTRDEVALRPSDAGVALVVSRRSAAPTVDQLARLGLDVRLRQADLLIAAWSTSIPDPAAQFVRLKTQTWFSAVCPVFEGARGGDLVAIHPRQLIVKARAGSAAPRDIVRELGLTPIEDRGYGLVLTSITAPRSDPTAVFRELHRINLRSSVAFAEPLLLPLPPSPT